MEMNTTQPLGFHSQQSEFSNCNPAIGALSTPSYRPIKDSLDPKPTRRRAPKGALWRTKRSTPASCSASSGSPKPLRLESYFNSQLSSVSTHIQTPYNYDGAYTIPNSVPVGLASVSDPDTSSEPRSICYVASSVETVPIENGPFSGLDSGEEEDCIPSPSGGNPADLLCDLFPELQTFSTPLPGGVETMDCGDVPVETISNNVTPTPAASEVDDIDVPGGFPQGPWTLMQPSLSDLSLLSNDEMDLELERFGYSNCVDTKDELEREVSHNQLCTNVNSSQQGGTPTCEEKPDLEASELRDICSENLYPQAWGGPFASHRLGEAYFGSGLQLDVAMTDDHSALEFGLGESLGSFIPCPYPRNSLFIDRSGVMKGACYCDADELEATNITCPSPYGVADVASYPLTTSADTVATAGESKCAQGDFRASPYPYLRPRLYPMHPPYTNNIAPYYDGYTSMESDCTTSSYTISRPSSCTLSRSVSAQGSSCSFLGNFEPPLLLQQQGSHGSSPEWTPPPTPLYVQFHSTCNSSNTQVESSQNSIKVQHFNNRARAYPSITPPNNAFIPTQVTFADDRSKASSYTGMRKNCIEPRQDNNELLVKLRDQGVSYKEIKKRLNCPEAESTLRGRHRTLTKDKSQRVRKPVWTDSDIRILINCVTSLILSPQNNQMSEERESGCKISARWKYISEEILRVGGSYKFGPGTCKKKYKELVEMGAAPAIQELEKRRDCRGGEVREERCARLCGRRKSARRVSKTKCSTK